MPYPGPFWIQRRDTDQYVVVQGSTYGYTSRKDSATEFARRPTAEKAFGKLGFDGATYCIIPSADID